MKIDISTTATSGQLLVSIVNSMGLKILTLHDTDSKSVLLVPGQTYTIKWHVWSPYSATYEIEFNPEQPNGDIPSKISRTYPEPGSDFGNFSFKA